MQTGGIGKFQSESVIRTTGIQASVIVRNAERVWELGFVIKRSLIVQ
jgi:hypothetical protein